MQFRLLPLVLAASSFLFTLGALGDTITLKTGEKIDGKIVKETDADYTVEFKVSASITDSRTVLKTEVEKVDKEAPDEVAFQAIKNIKLGANSLSDGGYDGAIRVLQNFLTQYPQSAHGSEIVPIMAAFAEEKSRVDAGEFKIDGKWISKEEVQKERYQIAARAVFGQMQDLARRGDLVGALNSFDQLEKNYPGASVYPDAVAVAQQAAAKLVPAAEQAQQTWQFQQKERDTATQLMSEPVRSQTIAAQKREQQQLDAAFESASKGSVKWPPFQRHEKTLAFLATAAKAEVTRLDKIPVAKMRESLQATEQARTALTSHNNEAAGTALKQATSLWSNNEIAVRLQKEVTELRAAAAKATPIPVPSTPVAVATPRATPPPPPVAPVVIPPPEEPKSFIHTPVGMGVIAVALLGLLAGIRAYSKKKQAADQKFE